MDEGTVSTQLLTSLETCVFKKCHKVSDISNQSCGHFELPVSVVSILCLVCRVPGGYRFYHTTKTSKRHY